MQMMCLVGPLAKPWETAKWRAMVDAAVGAAG